MSKGNQISPEDRSACVTVLQRIADDPSVIQDDEQIKALIAKIHRTGKKGERRNQQQERQSEDASIRQSTAMVQRDLLQQPFANVSVEVAGSDSVGTLHRAQRCYRCKQAFTKVHFFYHLMCPDCAALCYTKRHQCADLSGRVVLITGGRIKIGYQMALRMLRDGARVIITTRFPADALHRFSLEEDADDWRHRLVIHGLDLRHLPSVEAFVRSLMETEPYLDILINNAAQTVKRPREFYEHLLTAEEAASLPGRPPILLEACAGYPKENSLSLLSDFALEERDADGQPLDKRTENSWSHRLDGVGTVEMLEVQLVNAVAPFLLCSQLKPLLLRSPHIRRFIVNVSAMEGQFGRPTKTERHPHTNMAKAALNMLTRTSASDYARDAIYMNSVDTGWITDENPYERRIRYQQQTGFATPLDVLDGMARIYDPIAQGINEPDEPLFGHFLKDYAPYPW
jgi:NAD(P)-dependent dehydrogenase (short-subunit alcohol dehydrogenase family)